MNGNGIVGGRKRWLHRKILSSFTVSHPFPSLHHSVLLFHPLLQSPSSSTLLLLNSILSSLTLRATKRERKKITGGIMIPFIHDPLILLFTLSILGNCYISNRFRLFICINSLSTFSFHWLLPIEKIFHHWERKGKEGRKKLVGNCSGWVMGGRRMRSDTEKFTLHVSHSYLPFLLPRNIIKQWNAMEVRWSVKMYIERGEREWRVVNKIEISLNNFEERIRVSLYPRSSAILLLFPLSSLILLLSILFDSLLLNQERLFWLPTTWSSFKQ